MPTLQKSSRPARWAPLLALSLAAAALPGCQVWNAWLDALKWKDNPANNTHTAPLAPQPRPVTPGTPTGSPMLVSRVTVYLITLPVGTFSANEQIWAQLNEDAIDSKTSVLMAQNGLRAATGAIARWPGISKILLDTPGAAYYPSLLQTDGRTSIPVITRQNALDQTVVSVDRDHQLQGRTYERCDNGFRLAMKGLRTTAGTAPQLQLQLEPIVSLGNVQVVRPGMGITSANIASEESFEDLRMATTLTADQFLVVSALDPKSSSFSVGTLWLSDHDKIPATETVMVFVPAPTVPAIK